MHNKFLSIILFVFFITIIKAQNSLPLNLYKILKDSTTQVDIVYHYPASNSLSIEGQNVRIFNNFIESRTAIDSISKPDGFIMWLINGREFITGNFYLGGRIGYIKFKIDGNTFINKLSTSGSQFLTQQKRTNAAKSTD
ncbi:MAG: hypothetical protein NZ522_07640 [Chitinophagales bacterium]|nr:hypothetical protein [Chitinophagales bacterium]